MVIEADQIDSTDLAEYRLGAPRNLELLKHRCEGTSADGERCKNEGELEIDGRWVCKNHIPADWREIGDAVDLHARQESELNETVSERLKFVEQLRLENHGPEKYANSFQVLYSIAMDDRVKVQYRIKAANAYISRMNEVLGLEKRPEDAVNFNFVVIFDRDYGG